MNGLYYIVYCIVLNRIGYQRDYGAAMIFLYYFLCLLEYKVDLFSGLGTADQRGGVRRFSAALYVSRQFYRRLLYCTFNFFAHTILSYYIRPLPVRKNYVSTVHNTDPRQTL
jgi:hypothetical protein